MTPDGSPQTDARHCPIPAVRGGIVSRRGLFERLGSAARVTQISAPASGSRLPISAGRLSLPRSSRQRARSKRAFSTGLWKPPSSTRN